MKFRYLFLFLLLPFLSGCLKLDQDLMLRADGSGLIRLRYGMQEATIDQMDTVYRLQAAMTGTDPESVRPLLDFDIERVRRDLKELSPLGIDIRQLKSESLGDWRFMDMTLSFRSLQTLVDSQMFVDSALSLYRQNNGSYILRQKGNAKELQRVRQLLDSRMGAVMMRRMDGLHDEFYVQMRFRPPSKVVETNGELSDAGIIAWRFDNADGDDVLRKIVHAEMVTVFEGQGVQLPEINPPITL